MTHRASFTQEKKKHYLEWEELFHTRPPLRRHLWHWYSGTHLLGYDLCHQFGSPKMVKGHHVNIWPIYKKWQLKSLHLPHFKQLFGLNLRETTRLNQKMKNSLASRQVSYLLLNLERKYFIQFWDVLTGFDFAMYSSTGQVNRKRNPTCHLPSLWSPPKTVLFSFFLWTPPPEAR